MLFNPTSSTEKRATLRSLLASGKLLRFPGAFSPPPKVHSTVLRMTVAPRFAELQIKPEEFIGFLKTAFAMKRKTLLNNLKKDYREEAVRDTLKAAGIRADVRAEALPLEQSVDGGARLGRFRLAFDLP